MTEVFELPKESILNIPLMTLVGREEFILENYKGIIEYTDVAVRVNTGVGVVLVEGRNLQLKNIVAECITISGTVGSICFLG